MSECLPFFLVSCDYATDKHQADDNLPAASGRESPRAPLATFDDDSDLDFFYPALDGIKETSV